MLSRVLSGAGISLLVMLPSLRCTFAADMGSRADLPIREVVLGNQARLYSVVIKLGTTEIEAGLDTGSTGLRVMPGTLRPDDASLSKSSASYSFTSGVRYEGNDASTTLSLGDVTGPVTFEQIRLVACRPDIPDCPANRTGPTDYGVRGNSLTAGRFRAILGISRVGADLPHPLRELGIRRWIVSLPRPGNSTSGHLILNPSDNEIKDFVNLANPSGVHGLGLRDAVSGCLGSSANTKQACGYVILDTGAPGISLINISTTVGDWPTGADATLVLHDGNISRATEEFRLGRADQSSRVLAISSDARMPVSLIFAGSLPYYGFDVLYVSGSSNTAIRPRRGVTNGGPIAKLVP